MAPIAAGFMFMIFRAAFTGVLAGAVAGPLGWRLKIGWVRGALLATLAFLLLFATTGWHLGFMNLWLTWGLGAMLLTFFAAMIAARGLATRRLRPIWTTLISLGLALLVGFVFLFSFRISLSAPIRVAWVADGCVILLIALGRIVSVERASLFSPAAREAILDRLARLSPDARPLWGRFTAPEMICHMSSALGQALGELEARPPAGPLAHAPLNWLVIHLIRWPKGKGKSPAEFLAMRPTTWEADVEGLRDRIRRFAARGPKAEWPVNPVFGRISGSSWGVMEHKHLDHHLRQFGV